MHIGLRVCSCHLLCSFRTFFVFCGAGLCLGVARCASRAAASVLTVVSTLTSSRSVVVLKLATLLSQKQCRSQDRTDRAPAPLHLALNQLEFCALQAQTALQRLGSVTLHVKSSNALLHTMCCLSLGCFGNCLSFRFRLCVLLAGQTTKQFLLQASHTRLQHLILRQRCRYSARSNLHRRNREVHHNKNSDDILHESLQIHSRLRSHHGADLYLSFESAFPSSCNSASVPPFDRIGRRQMRCERKTDLKRHGLAMNCFGTRHGGNENRAGRTDTSQLGNCILSREMCEEAGAKCHTNARLEGSSRS